MSEHPVPFHVTPTLSIAREHAMSDEDIHDDRRSGRDRRSSGSHPAPTPAPTPALNNPQFWVSVCAVLLTVCLAVFGVIWSQLARIDANMQAYALKTTQNETEIAQIRREQERLDRERQMHEARIVVLEKQGTRIEERIRMTAPEAR